jgi:hypothetical protein
MKATIKIYDQLKTPTGARKHKARAWAGVQPTLKQINGFKYGFSVAVW